MIDSVETDENGKYTFSNIATYGTNEEGERVLYAYRVTLDEDSLPEGYGVTRYRVNDKDESSKLSSKDYELITNKELRSKINVSAYVTPTVGMPTLQDIMQMIQVFHIIQMVMML